MLNAIMLLTLAGPLTLAAVGVLSCFQFSGRHRVLLAASRTSAALSTARPRGLARLCSIWDPPGVISEVLILKPDF